MKPKILLRIAALLLLLNGAGHTMGFITRKTGGDAVKLQIMQSMENHKFTFNGSLRSLADFSEGNSLCVSATLFFLFLLLWVVSSHADKNPRLSRDILIAFLPLPAAFTAISVIYFFIGPVIFQAVVFTLVAAAIFRLSRMLKA